MLDYNEFPYQKYFFDSLLSINYLVKRVFPELDCKNNAQCNDSNFFEKEIDDYNLYLFVSFQSDIHDTFKIIEEKNRDIFFKNLIRHIENTNSFYHELMKREDKDYITTLLISKLVDENENKVQYLKNEFYEFVSYLSVYFSTKTTTIFVSKSAENWFLNALEELDINAERRGFQGKITAFFDVEECRKKIFKATIYKRNLIDYVNSKFGDVIKHSSNYSNSPNSQLELERHISNFPIPTE